MKKTAVMTGGLLIAISVTAVQLACDCEECRRRAASGKQFTMAELDALNRTHDTHDQTDTGHDEHAHDHSNHDEHDHAAHDEAPHGHECKDKGCAHDEVAAHPHAGCSHGHDEHIQNEDDHGAPDGLKVTDDMAVAIGLEVERAVGGRVARSVTFPAEIKLNRDRHASVRPRYDSRVREVSRR